MNILVLSAAVVTWAAVHSWLASSKVKAWVGRHLPDSILRTYRLGYNAFALVSFAPIVLLMKQLPDRVLYSITSPFSYLLLAGQVLAVICLLAALLQTDSLHFAGLRQIGWPNRATRLEITGFYRWVRHPLYLFGLVFLWLTPFMTINLLIVFSILTVYIFIGAVLEERRLKVEFGAAYDEYKSRTPMIFPKLGVRRTSTDQKFPEH